MDSEFSRKKALVLGVLSLVFLAIPVTVYTALQQQNSTIKASGSSEEEVVAIVNGEQITKAEIRTVAEEQYAPSSVDELALQDAQEILIERKILDVAVQTYGLTLDQKRVDRFKSEEFTEIDSKYEALKQQVTLAAVNSREAYSISFWNPPSDGINTLSIEEQADAAIQLSSGIPALDLIEDSMKSGENLEIIIQDTLNVNPELTTVLSLNGYIFAPLDNFERSIASYPQIYEFGNSSVDSDVRGVLFAQSKGGVVKVSGTESNRGGYVFKVENVGNESGSSTYEDWFEDQKSTQVQIVNSL